MEVDSLKRFECPHCNKRFTTRFSAKRHMSETCARKPQSEVDTATEATTEPESLDTDNTSTSASQSNTLSSALDSATSASESISHSSVAESGTLISGSNTDSSTLESATLTSESNAHSSTEANSDKEAMTVDEDLSATCEEEDHPFEDLLCETLQCFDNEYREMMSRDHTDIEMSDLKRRISKHLRSIFVDYFLDLEDKKRDPLFQGIMRKAKELEDREGFDTDEAISAAVAFYKHSINRLIPL